MQQHSKTTLWRFLDLENYTNLIDLNIKFTTTSPDHLFKDNLSFVI